MSIFYKYFFFIITTNIELLTRSTVCVPMLCKCTALELNHSAGGNCAENTSSCLCFCRPLRRNRRERSEAFSEKIYFCIKICESVEK